MQFIKNKSIDFFYKCCDQGCLLCSSSYIFLYRRNRSSIWWHQEWLVNWDITVPYFLFSSLFLQEKWLIIYKKYYVHVHGRLCKKEDIFIYSCLLHHTALRKRILMKRTNLLLFYLGLKNALVSNSIWAGLSTAWQFYEASISGSEACECLLKQRNLSKQVHSVPASGI